MLDLTLAHSPDADDLYMAAPIALGWLDSLLEECGLAFRLHEDGIDELNRSCIEGRFDVCAISFGAYPAIQHAYRLLASGASIQEGSGPVLVASRELQPDQLRAGTIAVPGEHTSSLLALRKWMPGLTTRVVPFSRILQEVAAGNCLAGILIDESQVDFHLRGLKKIVDLGEWWGASFGLPLPMGGMAVRSSLAEDVQQACLRIVRQGVVMAMERHAECMSFVAARRPHIQFLALEQHVKAWVNAYSVDPGPRGAAAVRALLGMDPSWVQGG